MNEKSHQTCPKSRRLSLSRLGFALRCSVPREPFRLSSSRRPIPTCLRRAARLRPSPAQTSSSGCPKVGGLPPTWSTTMWRRRGKATAHGAQARCAPTGTSRTSSPTRRSSAPASSPSRCPPTIWHHQRTYHPQRDISDQSTPMIPLSSPRPQAPRAPPTRSVASLRSAKGGGRTGSASAPRAAAVRCSLASGASSLR